jgi:DNA polymerase
MELPSGGFLSYAAPAIAPHPKTEQLSLSFMGINSYTKRWERIFTYGGKLSADATQATAREIFTYNWQHAEDEGFPIVLRVHDELVTEPPDDPAFTAERLMEIMTRRPPWIDDRLPLAAGGFEAYRYRKDD